MLDRIIQYSIHNKLIVFLFVAAIVGFGLYSLLHIPIGAVPDVTNNQVQVITTSRNLATEDVEKFLTYPVELEMANLPGVKEIRSVSKFGLSVVTIVFDDDLGTYLPRQLIAEKIKNAEERIPAGFGTPSMGPVTTGLGEIYQYIIEVAPEYKDQYSLYDIRTIQDWIIRRQLSGIPGVVEVNTWGGYLKQYEVAANPATLRALNIPLTTLYEALQKNNSIAGGGYIEKTNEAYFVRGEGLITSLDDIRNIVVENRDGVPIYVKDVAEVGFGHATRFGAITGNGEGEKVLGQVMMLKDADSKKTIENVKERVAEMESTLPPGIHINPFLERSELIKKTTHTIAENLILGCLIVIFVVVVLLGNLRSGLVVASVIPLSLLFALSLMYIFGVDANLMSLGAIDFGIIIDGAVIIVEFISYKITSERTKIQNLEKHERNELVNQITFSGASKMMHSAVFGQLIIIIVFIPILSLVNIEGKMFRPMALVFTFALIGAMLLCFTYVPVMASLFIKPSNPDKKTISSRIITFLENKYQPTMAWALNKKKLVVGIALALLIGAVTLYNHMGGEFVPTLDEGDFVIQPVLKTGTSLSKTISTMTQMEKILKKFPEVDQVVSRIGAAEVPTDPMSMEETDVIIKLIPKKQWTTAKTKDELADKFKEALSVLPGIEYEFTQPIEMRFNELTTGVRADLAVKIFGDDLDLLYKKALEVQDLISDVPGAADITVEKVAGLPQMSVKYDRRKVAKYGLNVEDLNKIVTMGFAGLPAGTIFDGEKQFDLVLRFDPEHRAEIESLETATIQLPGGNSIPLRELAEIKYTKGPAKISRDNTKRRIVVGVNVRNRDLESVVEDVESLISTHLTLPPGYTVSYGGQFENYRTASARLKVAVPIALLLIFVLLYFAFSSFKDAILIYSAIPLSSVGGVVLLYLRGLPFSISAGVGFIALFGIAVLNGIVLIEEFKELKAHGMTDLHQRILTGTRNRLRPVLLTASAAALGFLPMAISTSAGAEVQRPLATVVIGGLISATALTLVVLPVLYAMFDRKPKLPKIKPIQALFIGIGFLVLSITGNAQQPISIDKAINLAKQHNMALQVSEARITQADKLKGTAFDIDKTSIYYQYDENNIAENGNPLKVWGVSQTLQFPTVYAAQRKLAKTRVTQAENKYEVDLLNLEKEVSKAYHQLVFWKMVNHNYVFLDSVYTQFAKAAARKFETGESNYLEKLTAEGRKQEVDILLKQSGEEIVKSRSQLNRWIQSDTLYDVETEYLSRLELKKIDSATYPTLKIYADEVSMAHNALSIERQKLLPDIQLEAFRGTNDLPGAQIYNGFSVGIAVPLFFGNQNSRISAAKVQYLIAQNEYTNYKKALSSGYESLLADITKYQQALDNYDRSGKSLAKAILLNADKSFKSGEIDFLQYVQLLENAKNIEINYLNNLINYNLAVLEANYFTN